MTGQPCVFQRDSAGKACPCLDANLRVRVRIAFQCHVPVTVCTDDNALPVRLQQPVQQNAFRTVCHIHLLSDTLLTLFVIFSDFLFDCIRNGVNDFGGRHCRIVPLDQIDTKKNHCMEFFGSFDAFCKSKDRVVMAKLDDFPDKMPLFRAFMNLAQQ